MLRLGAALVCLLAALPARAEIVTRFPAAGKVVALTFDGCEGKGKPAWLDPAIVAALEREGVPATLFVTGLFARRNAAELARLAASPLIEVENHSWDHPQHMERLTAEQALAQVADADAAIAAVTGRVPRFFRFPAGHYDAATLAAVEGTGHRVVHWSWESGDPSPGLDPARLKSWVLSKARGGDILIFHINGRAPATARALPEMLAELKRRGFTFVRLDQALP
jgi:peptidoglycan/xylan/chitin deacetylase (PgdA/CDA1 family)